LSEVTEAEHFVAREEELAQIHDVLGQGRDRRTAVVHGLGGMGKTQLAVAYAKRRRDDYSAVFWLNARDEDSLQQGFARAAGRIFREYPSLAYIQNAIESGDLGQTVQAVKQWLNNPKNNRWLIIYDNYDDPMLTGDGRADGQQQTDRDSGPVAAGYDIRPFLPDSYHGAILITTRSSRVELGHRIPLQKLNELEDSLDILSHTSNRQELNQGDTKG